VDTSFREGNACQFFDGDIPICFLREAYRLGRKILEELKRFIDMSS
jgi:hypothetical protein